MPYPTETKFFSSSAPNAPAIYANAGGIVNFLDALLVTGYAAVPIADIVVTDGTAVVTTTLAHSLNKWMVGLVAGAGHAGLNGECRVIAASGAKVTFEVPAASVPNGTYSGGDLRVAPLGFEISASSANRRIYRSKDPRRNAVSLYVDDTNTVSGWNIGSNKARAQVKMVCAVVDIDNYTTLDTSWWLKSGAASGTLARPWLLAGDRLGFYSATDVASNGFSIASHHFIQLNTLAAGDQYATLLEGNASSNSDTTNSAGLGSAGARMSVLYEGTRKIARNLSQSGAAIELRFFGLGLIYSSYSSSSSSFVLASGGYGGDYGPVRECSGLAAVNPSDSSMVLGNRVIAAHSPTGNKDGLDFTARATLPGLFSVPSVSPFSVAPALQETPAGSPQSVLLGLPAATGSYAPGGSESLDSRFVGGYYVDVVGNWRAA